MNKGLLFELKKTVTGRTAGVVCLFCLLAVLLAVFAVNYTVPGTASGVETANIYAEASAVEAEDLAVWVDERFNENFAVAGEELWFDPAAFVYRQYYSHFLETAGYDGYINQTLENAEDLLSFASSDQTFYYRNIVKTKAAYEKLSGLSLSPVCGVSVDFITDNPIVEYTLLIAAVLLAVLSVNTEITSNTRQLILTTQKGRRISVGCKLAAVFFLILIIAAIVKLALLFYASGFLGLSDLSVPLQCVEEFLTSPCRLSIGEYLLLSFLLKTGGLFVIAAFAMLTATLCDNVPVCILVTAVPFAVEFIVYQKTSFFSAAYLLKECNLTALFNCKDCFVTMHNIDVFGFAVDAAGFRIVFSAGLIVGLFVLSKVCFTSGMRVKATTVFQRKSFLPKSLFGFEWKKFTRNQKMPFLLAGFIVVCIVYVNGLHYRIDTDEYYYRAYTGQIAEMNAEEQGRAIEQMRQEMEAVRLAKEELARRYSEGGIPYEVMLEENERLTRLLQRENALSRVEEQYQIIEELNRESSEGYRVVNNTAWQKIIPVYDWRFCLDIWIILTAFFIIGLSDMQLTDRKTGVQQLFSSSVYGGYVNKKKRKLACLFAVILTLIVNIVHVCRVTDVYGLSVKGIHFAEIALKSSVLGGVSAILVYAFLCVLEALAFCVLSVLATCISDKTGKHIPAVLLESGIIILPVVMLRLML